MATGYCNNVSCQKTSAFVLGFNWHFSLLSSPFGTPADGVSASLLHPPLHALPLIRAAEYCDQKSAEQQTRDNHHVLHRCCPNAGIELRRMALNNKEQEKRIVVPYFKQFSSALRGDLKHCYEQAY